MKILSFVRKWLLINILFLNYSFVCSCSAALIPSINSVPLVDDNLDSSYVLCMEDRKIMSVKEKSNTFYTPNEISKYRVIEVSPSIINNRLINHINNAVNLLNSLTTKINDRLHGNTQFFKFDINKMQYVKVNIEKNIELLNQKILTLNLLILNWNKVPYMLHKYFESIYYMEDSILNSLNIDSHVSYYELKLTKCIFFDPLVYHSF